MKKKLLCVLAILLLITNITIGQQPPVFFGINAWMPKYVGTQDVGGKLDGLWGTVSQSSPAYIRIGGIDFDNLNPAVVTGYRKNLTDMIGQIRAKMPKCHNNRANTCE